MLSFFERLDKFMVFKGLNDNKITIEANLANGIIGKGRKRGALSQDNISKLLYTYPELDANWLFTGNGEMIKGEEINTSPNEVLETQVSHYKLRTDYFGVDRQQIPLYEIEAAAGLATLFSPDVKQIPLDYITVPNAPKCDGAVFVRGDSMYPILKSGDIVCYKTIYDIDNVYFGEMYLIDVDVEGDQYLTFKYVQKSTKGDEYFCLVSHNEHHASKDILKTHIRAIAIVKLSIRYNTVS